MGGNTCKTNMAEINQMNNKDRVAACTIVSRNYAAYAKTLQDSLSQTNPDIDFYVLIVDRKDLEFQYKFGINKILWVEDLKIQNFQRLAFKFDILELNTNVKPFVLKKLAKDYNYVFYFDPDIYIYKSINTLIELLSNKTALLTPHATVPIDDDKKPGEIDFLRSGIFNLGFIGLRSCDESFRLLDWWGRRCSEIGFNDIRQSLFVDQKLVDLVPAFFDGVVITRSPIYNVAYWNLHERHIEVSDPLNPIVNGLPLVFFHYSGLTENFNGESRLDISKYQNRSDFHSHPNLKILFDHYRSKLIANGHGELMNIRYSYGSFSNGELINPVSRRLFSLFENKVDENCDPFEAEGPVYKKLAKVRALGGSNHQAAASSYNSHKYSTSMKVMEKLLYLSFLILGPSRYNLLMSYFGYISSLRNQKSIFFSDR